MGFKQCDKCGEMVDDAKAFCPGCGNSFVVEAKRESVSNFDTFEGTVKLGDTMYNQMLTDMGLNISKAPNTEKRIEVVAPAMPEEKPFTPPVAPPASSNSPRDDIAAAKPTSNKKWLIVGGVIIVVLFIFIVAAAIIAFAYFYYR